MATLSSFLRQPRCLTFIGGHNSIAGSHVSQSASSWHTSGTCHLGQYQRAIQDYDKAIQVDPDHVKAYTNRGNACKSLGQKAKADADFGKACFLDKEYCD